MSDGVALLSARTVAPMSGPAITNGAVALRGGRVLATGLLSELKPRFAGAVVSDYGDALILPGLVNAHTHLELTLTQRPERPGSFQDWVLAISARMPRDETQRCARVRAATLEGIRQSLASGVTCVGDISQHSADTRAVLSASALAAVSFGECLGLGPRRARFDMLLSQAMRADLASERLRVGVSPHAPYTVDSTGYAAALATSLPLCTHLAETTGEAPFLFDRGGPFRDLYDRFGFDPGPGERFAGGPIRFAHSVGLLTRRGALAHVNYCDDVELELLRRGDASVVYCPRTHDYFGHPPHRWREMTEAGINVAIGTDSAASSPNLNLVDDLRLMRAERPDFSAESLWRMATINGARALGFDDVTGNLGAGARADLCVFNTSGVDAFSSALDLGRAPIAVYADGKRFELSTS